MCSNEAYSSPRTSGSMKPIFGSRPSTGTMLLPEHSFDKSESQVSPGSKIEGIEFTTRWKELQSHITKGKDRGKDRL